MRRARATDGSEMEDKGLSVVRPDYYVNLTKIAQAHNKKLAHYNCGKTTKEYLRRLSAKTGISGASLVQQQHGSGANQATWGHPEVAVDVAAWCSRKRPQKTGSGYVYLATSPLLDAVKIGCWTGSLANLKSRYLTPYGPDVQIEHVFVPNCVSSENQMHVRFLEFNRGGELFDKTHALEYSDALRSLT